MKMTSQEFITNAKNLVGDQAGWEDRIASAINLSPKTVAKFAQNGCSWSTGQALKSALGIIDPLEPSPLHDGDRERRDAEEEMGLWT